MTQSFSPRGCSWFSRLHLAWVFLIFDSKLRQKIFIFEVRIIAANTCTPLSHFSRVSFTREVHIFILWKTLQADPFFCCIARTCNNASGRRICLFLQILRERWFGKKMQPKHVQCNMTVYVNNLRSFLRWRQQADVIDHVSFGVKVGGPKRWLKIQDSHQKTA